MSERGTGTAEEITHRVPLAGGWRLWPIAAVRGAGIPFDLLERLAMPELLAMPSGPERDTAIRTGCAEGIDAIVRDELIVEAMTWQNPAATASWLLPYVAGLAAGRRPSLSHKRAHREAMVARYAQRYCAKNESIGFFGPVGWARFTEGTADLRSQGSGKVRRRSAYLEVWAVTELAAAWAAEPELLPFLPARRDPAVTWSGTTLRVPRRAPASLDPASAALVSAADGRLRVGELLDTAGRACGASRDDLLTALWRLRDRRVLQVGFLVPVCADPEWHLYRQVQELPDDAPRKTELLDHLNGLMRARAEAADSHGAVAACRAIQDVGERFAKAGCAAAAGQRSGDTGRTPVYLDSRRDLDVEIGAGLLDPLRAPLSILLDSASWLTRELASAVAGELRERYRLLRERGPVVTLSDLQFAAADILATGGSAVPDVRADFRLRWAEILGRPGPGETRLSSAEVAPLARALFPPGPPGWSAARQHSPDLMLSRGPEGSARWVLGELHVGLNTLESRVFRTQCDEPEKLVAATEADMCDGRVVPLYPYDATEVTSRTYPPLALDPPGLYRYWSFGSDQGHPDGVATTAGTAILVEEGHDGELIGRDPAGGWEAPVLEFFGEFLSALVANLFKICDPLPHRPRVLIDDVVVCRESWSVTAEDLPVPRRRSDDYAYETLRSWAAGIGVPRRVFVRTALEAKPFYVDFSSPLLIGVLARAVRRARAHAQASPVDIVEMYPGPEGLWLTDEDGRRYTSEFRVVATHENHCLKEEHNRE